MKRKAALLVLAVVCMTACASCRNAQYLVEDTKESAGTYLYQIQRLPVEAGKELDAWGWYFELAGRPGDTS